MRQPQPGALDQRVRLQRRIETDDGAGGVARSWADLPHADVWAQVRTRASREGLIEGRMVAVQATVFTIRWRGDVDETCRLIWGGETWNIRAVLRHGDRVPYLAVEAERGVAE
jgi:SPP1 family predicted phage head-tail adaptor